MLSRSIAALLCSSWLLLAFASARGDTAGQAAPRIDDELARLQGHQVRPAPDGYVIEDVAGEGRPLVGVIERRGDALWLVAGDAAHRLAGVLARPRIAGPGYKVWILGEVSMHEGERVLVPRRIGVLAPPWRGASRPPQARAERSTILEISAGAPTRTGGPQ